MKNRKYFIVLLLIIIGFSSCKKYLDAKPDSTLGTLGSVDDVELFFDSYDDFNRNRYPVELEIGADTYYVLPSNYNSAPERDRSNYIWKQNETSGGQAAWQACYRSIYLANIALNSLEDLSPRSAEMSKYNALKGAGLFLRGFYLHSLSQLFTMPYDRNNAKTTLGLPLRTDPEFETVSVRASLYETYDRILSDLKASAEYLPNESAIKTRPTKAAANALIARVYLSMREYDSAGVYANKSLQTYNSLMEYSDLNASATSPISRFNKEVIFWATSTSATILNATNARIDPILYQSYDNNDLRKTVFFRANTGAGAGTYSWKGGYDGGGIYLFGGMTTDEVLLTRAECYARQGESTFAMKDLNNLLRTRWKKVNGTTTYVDQTALNAQSALMKILEERKKELLYRGVRWMDMRRLSQEPAFALTYKRQMGDQAYELIPGSDRYALLIPIIVIQQTGMQQNP